MVAQSYACCARLGVRNRHLPDSRDGHLAVEAALDLVIDGPLQRDGVERFAVVEGDGREFDLDLAEGFERPSQMLIEVKATSGHGWQRRPRFTRRIWAELVARFCFCIPVRSSTG